MLTFVIIAHHSCCSHISLQHVKRFLAAAKSNHIQFGDCYISDPKVLTFAMTNHSKSDVMRFQWPAHDQMKFSPMTGHLHPGHSKDITVTFKASEPIVLTEVEVACRVVKIIFTKASNEVGKWFNKKLCNKQHVYQQLFSMRSY